MGSSGATGKTQQGAVSGMMRSLSNSGQASVKRGGGVGEIKVGNVTGSAATKASGKYSKIEVHTQTNVYNVKNVTISVNSKGVATIKGYPNAKLGYKGDTSKGVPILHTKGVSSGSTSKRAYAKKYEQDVRRYTKQGMTQKQARAQVAKDRKAAKNERMSRAAKYGKKEGDTDKPASNYKQQAKETGYKDVKTKVTKADKKRIAQMKKEAEKTKKANSDFLKKMLGR